MMWWMTAENRSGSTARSTCPMRSMTSPSRLSFFRSQASSVSPYAKTIAVTPYRFFQDQRNAGQHQQDGRDLFDERFVHAAAALHAEEQPCEREREQQQGCFQGVECQQAQCAVKHDAERIVHDKHRADICLERTAVLGHAADIGGQQRAHAEQTAQHARRHADDRQHDFRGAQTLFCCTPAKTFPRPRLLQPRRTAP